MTDLKGLPGAGNPDDDIDFAYRKFASVPAVSAREQTTNEERRHEIRVLIGPCDDADAEWLMDKVFDVVVGRLGAVVSLHAWKEDEPDA